MESCPQDALQNFLKQNAIDLHHLSLEEFRDWLEARIAEAARHPLFQQRCRARDLRRQYKVPLRFREQQLKQAEEAYQANPRSAEIEELRETIYHMTNAVAGLSQAVAEERASSAKLAEYEKRQEIAVAQLEKLCTTTPAWHRLKQAQQSLEEFQRRIGLTQIEETIAKLNLKRGRHAGRSGRTFEQTASQLVRDAIGDARATGRLSADGRIELLHQVTLGNARGEFDQMVVTVPQPGGPVRVLAVVETKRNINDLVHGFRLRQENLAWLAGDSSGYAADLYRTRNFPEGHFTRATHHESGQLYHFDRDSFQQYASVDSSGYRLRGLWFVTRERPLLGATSSELGQIFHQVSTNPTWNLTHDSGLGKFRKWVLNKVSDFQTQDVFRLYAGSPDLASQILFCE